MGACPARGLGGGDLAQGVCPTGAPSAAGGQPAAEVVPSRLDHRANRHHVRLQLQALELLLDPTTGSPAHGSEVVGILLIHVDDSFFTGTPEIMAYLVR